MKALKLSLVLISLSVVFGCNDDGIPADPQVREYSDLFAPLPTGSFYPSSNSFSVSKERLGELLFWDPILSGDQNVACASCHHPDFGWADGRGFSVGSDGLGLGPTRSGLQVTPLHAPTILNVSFTGIDVATASNSPQSDFVSGGYFWDLRADTLEEQALGPIHNPVEMLGYNVPVQEIMNEIVMRLQAIPEYVELFDLAFADNDAVAPAQSITPENIAKAIATFERKIISPATRFDEFMAGDTATFSQAEIIGLNKFIDGGCARCHSGPMLSDNQLRADEIVIGGRAVRTPSLRNMAFTAPYMHDGSHVSLRDAIAAYEDRGDLQVTLDENDFGDIETFLRTLDTVNFYAQIPESVPSGLPVGGDIR